MPPGNWDQILSHDINRWVNMLPQQMETRIRRMSKTDKLAATLAIAEIIGSADIRQSVLERADSLGKRRHVIRVANGIPVSSIITTDTLRQLSNRYAGGVTQRERDEIRRGYPATLFGRVSPDPDGQAAARALIERNRMMPLGDSRLGELVRDSSPPVNATVTGRVAGSMPAIQNINPSTRKRKKVKIESPKLRKIRFKKKKEKRKIRFKKGN